MGESSTKEDQNSNKSVIDLATSSKGNCGQFNNNNNNLGKRVQRQETPLSRTLFSNNYLSYNYLPVLI